MLVLKVRLIGLVLPPRPPRLLPAVLVLQQRVRAQPGPEPLRPLQGDRSTRSVLTQRRRLFFCHC